MAQKTITQRTARSEADKPREPAPAAAGAVPTEVAVNIPQAPRQQHLEVNAAIDRGLSDAAASRVRTRRSYAEYAEDGKGEEAASRVARRYTYIKDEEVKAFLTHHPDIAKTLLASVPSIEKIFGRGVTLTLQVLVDQDGKNDVSLFARIQTPKPVREAISLRKQFYREWWMKQKQALESPLNFEVEAI